MSSTEAVGNGEPSSAEALSSVGRIIGAARVALRRSGSVTLDLIAKEAGVGIATLYRHFPNREALTLAVMERIWIQEVRPLIVEFSDSGASRQDLLRVAEQVIEVFRHERGVIGSLPGLSVLVAGHFAGDAALREAISRAKDAGSLRDDVEPADVVALLAMMTSAPLLLEASASNRRRYLSLMLDGLNPDGVQPLPPRSAVDGHES